MDYKDYIKEECHDIYLKERDNLADRLIEAKYNLQFLKMVHERSELYSHKHDVTECFEIRVIMRRIHVTVAWELALQIKAFTDDTAPDTLTVSKLQNKMFAYIKENKKQEIYDNIGTVVKSTEWSDCKKIVNDISDYRNQIVGHNIFNPPELYFDINEAERVISVYESLFKELAFNDVSYIERANDIEGEMKNFIKAYLDALLPLE
mgnify:FL=1